MTAGLPQDPEREGYGLAESAARNANPNHRVTFGAGTFCFGLMVTHLTFSLLFGIAGGGTGVLVGVLFYGVIPALITALVLGLPTGLLMRSVHNQWLHVLAFALVGAVAGLLWAALSESAPLFALLLGLSAAVGRLSVWKAVKVNV